MAIAAFLDDIKDTEQREATDYTEPLKDTREQKKNYPWAPFPLSLPHNLFQHINAVLSSLPTHGLSADVKQLFPAGLGS